MSLSSIVEDISAALPQEEEAPEQWRLIPINVLKMKPETILKAHRLNSLGSLFYLSKVVLRNHKFTYTLHKEMCELIERDTLKEVIEIPRDHYKALALTTLIPTPQGFKTIKDIKQGDFVFGLDGTIVKVIGESQIYTSNKCYEVTFSSGEKVVCDAGHLWETDVRKVRANKGYTEALSTDTTENIARSVIYNSKIEPKSGNIVFEYNHKVQVAKSVQLPDKFLPIPPYTLGAWLGDGSSCDSHYTCDVKDGQIIIEIMKDGYKVSKQKAKHAWGILGAFTSDLRRTGVLNNKHIPEVYLRSSPAQRLALVQGLMDTDGSVSKEGQCSFQNTNFQLVEKSRELIASLGLKPSPIATYRAKLNGQDCGDFYTFSFYPDEFIIPFRLQRKIDRVRAPKRKQYRQIINVVEVPSVPVKCIMVNSSDGLYLVGEGFIPTHNTTCYSVCAPIWWALPFTDTDENLIRSLGYSDRFIKWMKRAHNQNTRTLVVSEVIDNAIKIGSRIKQQYESNDFFQVLFPEVIPDTTCKWTEKSLTHKRLLSAGLHGEGTYDFLGVGGALQSRHYDRVIQDDLVGRDAIASPSVMETTIDYHKLLVGAFDSDGKRDNDEIVVGNRWSYNDLNSHIREYEPYFRISNHSALGGCCSKHRFGKPIFAEEFTVEKLERWKARLGSYHFAAQFLNNPIPPGGAFFNTSDLRYYDIDVTSDIVDDGKVKYAKVKLVHEVVNGQALTDVHPGHLQRTMVVDPNHSGNEGRCRHAITVTGVSSKPNRVYLLDCWAEACGYEEFIQQMIKMASFWKLNQFWLETVAAQKYLKFHLDYVFRQNNIQLKVNPLKVDKSAGAKAKRIESLQPIFETGRFWIRKSGQENFVDEFSKYQQGGTTLGKTLDILDTLGYAPETWHTGAPQEEVQQLLSKHKATFERNVGIAGY